MTVVRGAVAAALLARRGLLARTPRSAAAGAAAARAMSASWLFGESELPAIHNEPFQHYALGSQERTTLRIAVDRQSKECPHVPMIIDGKHRSSGDVSKQLVPHRHERAVCTYERLRPSFVDEAIKGALKAKTLWENTSMDDRAAVFLKAADLLSTKYRAELNAAVMHGQSKTVWQAEIDAAVETIDFWRFGVKYAKQIYSTQPPEHDRGVWNRLEYRALEGFVAAITPFNFIAIAANLPCTPVLMGNVCLWKPSDNSVRASKLVYDILTEAGLPDGVIQFLPGDGATFAKHVTDSPDLAAVHFTGSTSVCKSIYKQLAANIDRYRNFPRLVGETGGKNFHLVHASADVESAVNATVRGSFEFQGQKCSATSRAYVARSVWPDFRAQLLKRVSEIRVGDPVDFTNFMGAVIHDRAFKRVAGYIDRARKSSKCEVIAGGKCDDSVGYFVEPTVIVSTDARYESMQQEIFGPVLTVYVYEDKDFERTLKLIDSTSDYALTGGIFARERAVIAAAAEALRYSAGNFYINDKCTGSIVGQQPFGGGRMSGTNDKSGSANCYLRFCSPRSIKENLLPTTAVEYPSMQGDPREDYFL